MQRWKTLASISAGIVVGGIWSTNLAPVAIAQVAAALVRDADGPVRGIPHGESIQINIANGNYSAFNTIRPLVPADKNFFIQSVTVLLHLTDGQNPTTTSVTLNYGETNLERVRFNVDMDHQGTSATSEPVRYFIGNRSIDMMLNKGQSLSATIARTDDIGDSGLNFATVTFTGYLVDITP